MRTYSERLYVPLWWWLVGLAGFVWLGTELVAGLGWLWTAVGYAAVGGSIAVILVWWGWARVEVTAGELHAGKARLPLADAGEVTGLDEAQTRSLRGPRADPAALLVTRPYVPRAVYVEVAGPRRDTPYWLVSTRHPAELAAAIDKSRRSAGAGGAAVG
jgi:Protein of unknown function (DUF3093)